MTITLDDRVTAVRRFNRLFTREIGALREGLLHTEFPLTEARILYELGQRKDLTAADLCAALGLDSGYLSRLVAKLEQRGVIEKITSETDGRQRLLRLTRDGWKAFELLDRRSREEVADLLSGLTEDEQRHLLNAMQIIEGVLTRVNGLKYSAPFIVRPHEPGDMGWVTHRHGVLYAQEYGWDERFEALVAQIVSDFITNFQPERERCWIAEVNGAIVGSVFVVQAGETTAKLRLLLVEPKARGMGLGTRLVQECIRFAKRAGYRKLTLWTQSNLLEARHIYAKCGFTCVKEEPSHLFGHDLVSETWELAL